ncbi:LAQU0S03e02542g1_1 [Lachancea quebecensis]|uniref:LAQU0S03e02542g1_1 n=1 Tax=Lachancea quebecensis TaxID=1654605 RepID=A0A0N7ML67_9SACH|nr:LAQU0S03e02542g1_1 [Lachancea quebecensis]
MDDALLERFEAAKRKINAPTATRQVLRLRNRATHIVNKYKYASRAHSAERNPHLSGSEIRSRKLYEKRGASAHNVFSRQEFMQAVRELVQATRHSTVLWNSRRVNVVQMASKGWHAQRVQKGEADGAALHCKNCRCSFYLKLDDYLESEQLGAKFDALLADRHAPSCYWRNKAYNLALNYYLTDASLYLEFERINKELENYKRSGSVLDLPHDGNTDALKRTFGASSASLGSLALALRGYTLINSEIAECTGCFRRTFVATLKEPDTNNHVPWCKFADEQYLTKMLLRRLERPGSNSLGDRLQDLELRLHGL